MTVYAHIYKENEQRSAAPPATQLIAMIFNIAGQRPMV